MTDLENQLPLDSQFAALDLGSNSFHLIVATESNGRLQVVDKIKEMVRLSEGLVNTKRIDEVVANRAIDCLGRYSQRLRSIPPENVRVVGTNALRQAKNAGAFLRKAEATLGHKIEIISGREEARLIYLGVAHDVEIQHEQRLVVDIGGGSTEIILGRKTQPQLIESLHIGCVSLSLRAFADGKLSRSNFKKAREFAAQEIEPVAEQYRSEQWGLALGASGTISTAQTVALAMAEAEGASYEGLNKKALARIVDEMVSIEKLDKLQLPGLSSERAAVFPGGIAILQALLHGLGIDELQVAQGALREGLLYDLIGRAHQQDTRESTTEDLMRRYHVDVKHARRIRDTALSLLAQVAKPWDLTSANVRLTLGWGAMLHEIGMDISHSQYHKHGGYLLEHMDMPGFSTAEQNNLATLVRSHRRKFPKEEFANLGYDTQMQLYLSVLLRVSVLMHRNRSAVAQPHLQASANNNKLTLSLPKNWLESHPLTQLDFAQEADYLATVDIKLNIEAS